jgi:hypothetical protein
VVLAVNELSWFILIIKASVVVQDVLASQGHSVSTETVDSGMKIDAVEGKKYISLLELRCTSCLQQHQSSCQSLQSRLTLSVPDLPERLEAFTYPLLH